MSHRSSGTREHTHTYTYALFYPFPIPPCSNPTQTGPPTPTWVVQQCPLSKEKKSLGVSTPSISDFKLIGRSVSTFSLSPILAAPAPAGHRANSHPRLVIGLQLSGTTGHVGQ